MKKPRMAPRHRPGTADVQVSYGAYSGVTGSYGGGILLTSPNFAMRKGETCYVIKNRGGGPPLVVGADGV